MESIYLFPFSFDGRRLFEGRQKFQSSSPTITPSMQNPVGSMEVPYLANSSFHLTLAIVLGAVLCTFLCLLVHYRHDCWSRWQLVLDPSFNPAVGGNVSMTNIDIEALPTTVYRTGLPFSAMNCPISLSESTAMVCPICLSEFVGGEKLRVLPGCCHSFHMDCVDAWLISSSTCPSCRQSLPDVRFKK